MNWIDWILLKLLCRGLDPTMTLPGDRRAASCARRCSGKGVKLWLAALLLVIALATFSHLWIVWWTSQSASTELFRTHWIEFSAAGGCFLSTFCLAAYARG